MERLYDRLSAYQASDYYGFHMPGHKRQASWGDNLPFGIDITEIEGFDDLHHASGILKDAQELTARVYGAEESRFLVNGSTVGILSAILGCTKKGDKILFARQCHKSVYHAVYLNELNPVYLYPEFDEDLHLNTSISVSAVKTALMEHSDIRAVVIVSPTYDGVISDVEGIAAVVHAYGIPLIVDEAHGAHLGFHPYFDKNALAKGVDVVIHSVHKTLPSLTQTAILHVQGELADRRRIFRYLDMLQSSSPSYVLMASIDNCVHLLAEKRDEMFVPYVKRLQEARAQLKRMKYLKLLETEHYDWSKIVVSAKGVGLSGRELYRILRVKYHLQMEMAAGTYVIAMTSISDTDEGFQRLVKAFLEIDSEIGLKNGQMNASKQMALNDVVEAMEDAMGRLPKNPQVMNSARALEIPLEETEMVLWEESVGRISVEYAYLYPPGSPLIVPGEQVTEEAVRLLQDYRKVGFSIEGLEKDDYLRVQKNW